jgi:hypothetical protein
VTGIFATSNLKNAAIVVLAVMLVENFTASQSTLIRGAAMFGGAAVALHLASKI